jgi:hypothetical protein
MNFLQIHAQSLKMLIAGLFYRFCGSGKHSLDKHTFPEIGSLREFGNF